jgi:hypothetical protein
MALCYDRLMPKWHEKWPIFRRIVAMPREGLGEREIPGGQAAKRGAHLLLQVRSRVRSGGEGQELLWGWL